MLFGKSYLKSKKPVIACLMSPKRFFFFTLLVFRKGMEFFFSSLLSRKASGQKVVISCVEIQANETQIIGI